MEKNFISISILFFILFFSSCTEIEFYNKKNDSYVNSSGIDWSEEISSQISSLRNSNPQRDALISYLLFDRRFVSIITVGTYYPAVNLDLLTYRQQFSSKTIWGTGDCCVDQDLMGWAISYAYQYNLKMLELTDSMDKYIMYPDDEYIINNFTFETRFP